MPFSFLLPPLRRRITAIGCFLVLVLGLLCLGQDQTIAATGPFSGFTGRWSGSGTIRQDANPAERVRCAANYRTRGSAGHEVDLQLRCTSDNYNFDLAGQFQADAANHIGGRWSESSRNIGGTVVGSARGDRLQIHVESSAFAANLVMVTRGRRQAVTIDSFGGGQVVRATITLRRS